MSGYEDQMRDAGRGHLLPGSALPVPVEAFEVTDNSPEWLSGHEQLAAGLTGDPLWATEDEIEAEATASFQTGTYVCPGECDCGGVGSHDGCPLD